MTYCSNCGKELPEDAYFCLRCGLRTKKGAEAGISTQWEDLSATFSRMGMELEKAFTTLGKEMEKAFKATRNKIKEATKKEPINCSSCKERNQFDAKYCFNCGENLRPEKT